MMAQHNYQPLNAATYAETTDNPDVFAAVYGVHVCFENAFSDQMIQTIANQLISRRFLLPITIHTGGGYNNQRFPAQDVYRGNGAAFEQLRRTNQFRLSANIGGNAAFQQVLNYYDARAAEGHDWPGVRPATMNAVNINMANFMWRYTHKGADGAFRKVPAGGEISHTAEAYNAAHEEWGATKVEITEVESGPVNESRKDCTRFGRMWLKPNGDVIGEHEPYNGPSQCPHSCYNSPCYAPYPVLFKTPTGATPNVRKAGGKTKKRKVETPLRAISEL